MAEIVIPQNDPKAAFQAQRRDIQAAITRVLDSGWYILGKETRAFEEEFAAAMQCRHGIGTGSGTDALVLALRALGIGPGDSVVTVSHTAVATVAAIELVGAKPLLVDIDPARYTMDPAELGRLLAAPPAEAGRVAAVLVVHLYGQPADLAAVGALARQYRLRLIEDCAQCHGAEFDGRRAGSFGDVACFSFYPTKNLGAIGDGGMLVTSDDGLAGEVRAIREYGWRQQRYVSERTGMNSRLDELQAAILRVKLGQLDADNARRRNLAHLYDRGLAGLAMTLPARDPRAKHVFHQYVVRTPFRELLQAALRQAGIGSNIHYPVPVHLQPAYTGRLPSGPSGLGATEQAAREILSLPMYPQLEPGAVSRVIDSIERALRIPAQSA